MRCKTACFTHLEFCLLVKILIDCCVQFPNLPASDIIAGFDTFLITKKRKNDYLCAYCLSFHGMRIRIVICFLLVSVSSLLRAETSQRAVGYERQAVSCTCRNDHVRAFRLYVKGLMAALDDGDDLTAMRCYGNISIIYHNFGDAENSLYFANKGYDIARRTDSRTMVKFLTNLITFYSQAGDTVRAAKYYAMASSMISDTSSVRDRYFLIYEHARLEHARRHIVLAEALHKQARTFAEKNKMPEVYVLYQNSELGNIMVEQKRWQEALTMGHKCLLTADRLKEKDLTINSYKMIADAFYGLGRRDSAWCYMTKYEKLKNEIYDMPGFFRVQSDMNKYWEDHTAWRLGWLNAVAVVSVTLVSVFLILIFVVINKNRRLKRKLLTGGNDDHGEADITGDDVQVNESGSSSDGIGEEEKTRKMTDPLDVEAQEKLLKMISAVFNDVSAISDPDFSLGSLAERVGSNTKYVSTVINRAHGKNFKTLLNEHRIREACRRMADDDYARYTLKAIAADVGFRNTVSFIRCFKNVTGMTPSAYQRRQKDDGDD